MNKGKLYVVVCADLLPGDRAAQSCHAALAFAFRHRELAETWFWDSNNIVLLECADEPALLSLVERARALGLPYALFSEPDFGSRSTAAAFAGGARKFLSSLPLALREPKKTAA